MAVIDCLLKRGANRFNSETCCSESLRMRIWENLKLDPPSGADGTGVFGSGITVRGNFLLLQVFTFAFSYASVIDDQHGFYG